MSTLYRLLTEDDTSAFCHKVSAAWSKWSILQNAPVYTFDAARGVMRCGQAVTKVVDAPYGTDMKLGEQ